MINRVKPFSLAYAAAETAAVPLSTVKMAQSAGEELIDFKYSITSSIILLLNPNPSILLGII